jgi:anti-sigma B factor antagonist
MGFQVTTRELGDVTVVDAAGRLTLGDGGTRLRDLIHVLAKSGQKKYLLNLAGVEFVDSYGIGELARCYATVRQVGGEIKLARLSKKVHDTLQVTNLHTLFEIHTEEMAAVQAFLRRA